MTEQKIERCLERFTMGKATDVMNFDYAGTLAYIQRLKAENASLRERLEKAVELPCKLYDKVWDKNRSEFEILEIRVTGTNFYIYCGNKTTGETVYFDGEDIGDEWFTTEEACDLHRRAFGLDKPKNESDESRLVDALKTENAALRERLEKYKISFKKVYMDFFSKLNLDKDFRKRFDNVTLGCQLKMFEDALDKAEARLAELKGEEG